MPEPIRCECTEHGGRPCVPIPAQHVRYQIRVGPEEQGLIKLCAFCFINGHHGMKEYRWRGQQEARRIDAKTS